MSRVLRSPGDILAELQQHIEHALRPAQGAMSIRGSGWGTFPAIDIGTTADTIEVVAFAPGIDPARLEVVIDKGLLTISGERPSALPDDPQGVSVYAQERFSGPFRRVLSLPEDADPAKVEARYQDGFLRVSVGKRESSKPRRVDIH
jgi:HSP20 family protein